VDVASQGRQLFGSLPAIRGPSVQRPVAPAHGVTMQQTWAPETALDAGREAAPAAGHEHMESGSAVLGDMLMLSGSLLALGSAAYLTARPRAAPTMSEARDIELSSSLAPAVMLVTPEIAEESEHTLVAPNDAVAGVEAALAESPDLKPAVFAVEAEDGGFGRTLKIGTYFALWYALNIGYNIYNKKALNLVPLPWTLATIQMFAGIPYVLFMWLTGLRKPPKLSTENVKTLTPSALCHLGTHIGAVLSLGAGAVSFTHIVKASEPVVSAAMSAVFLKQFLPIPVYLSLLPVIGGVGLASLTELSFTWFAFATAMLSNVASAGRGVLSKGLMGKDIGENLTTPNLFGVLTIIAFCFLFPISLLVEPTGAISAAVTAATTAGATNMEIFKLSALSGLFYYFYNEVAFLALSEVAPVTHAVGNTIKRVVIILASVIVFRNPLTPLGALGSAIAVGGTLVYSLAKQKFSK
jgi:solute carrier family 35 protein E1